MKKANNKKEVVKYFIENLTDEVQRNKKIIEELKLRRLLIEFELYLD
jgi:hypothetical protein